MRPSSSPYSAAGPKVRTGQQRLLKVTAWARPLAHYTTIKRAQAHPDTTPQTLGRAVLQLSCSACPRAALHVGVRSACSAPVDRDGCPLFSIESIISIRRTNETVNGGSNTGTVASRDTTPLTVKSGRNTETQITLPIAVRQWNDHGMTIGMTYLHPMEAFGTFGGGQVRSFQTTHPLEPPFFLSPPPSRPVIYLVGCGQFHIDQMDQRWIKFESCPNQSSCVVKCIDASVYLVCSNR